MKKSLITLALLTGCSASVNASSPVWNTIEIAYLNADIEGDDNFEPDGFGIAGSYLLGKDFFIGGSYSRLSEDVSGVDFDFDTALVGIGYRYGVTTSTDIWGAVSYEYVELSADGSGNSASADENGCGLTVGVRSMVMSNLELNAALAYVGIDDADETGVEFGADYFFTPNLSIGASYAIGDDVDTWGINARYAF